MPGAPERTSAFSRRTPREPEPRSARATLAQSRRLVMQFDCDLFVASPLRRFGMKDSQMPLTPILIHNGYLGVYSRMQVTWRLTIGEVDGEPSIVLLNMHDGAWEIEGIIRLDFAPNGRIERISDYQHCPWILTAGSIVVREPVA